MMDMKEVILKPDQRGRLRQTPEQKQALIEACQTGGPSGPRFAPALPMEVAPLAAIKKAAPRTGDGLDGK